MASNGEVSQQWQIGGGVKLSAIRTAVVRWFCACTSRRFVQKENNDVAAMEGQDEEAPAADSAGGN